MNQSINHSTVQFQIIIQLKELSFVVLEISLLASKRASKVASLLRVVERGSIRYKGWEFCDKSGALSEFSRR